MILGIVLIISLWTFEISDPNWKVISSSETNLTNGIGIVGAWLSSFLYELLGITAWSIIILLFYPAFASYLRSPEEKPVQKNYFFSALGFFIFCSSLCLLIDLHFNSFETYFPETSSGILGTIISVNLYPYLSFIGSTLFGIFFLMVSFSLMVSLSWKNTFVELQDNFKNLIFLKRVQGFWVPLFQ